MHLDKIAEPMCLSSPGVTNMFVPLNASLFIIYYLLETNINYILRFHLII
jgi:hypothetical protein